MMRRPPWRLLRSIAAAGLLAIPLASVAAAPGVSMAQRMFFQPSEACESPYLSVDPEDDGPAHACNGKPTGSSGMWAHSPDNHGRGAQLRFYDARDDVMGYLDADASLTGMLTVRPEGLSGYAAAGTANVHMWIEVGGLRFGGFAHGHTTTLPTVLGVFQFPFDMPIPDALDGTALDGISVGVEFSGVQHGFTGVRGAGESWIDFPVQDRPSQHGVSPGDDCSSGAVLSPQMSSTSLTIPAAPDTDPTVNRTWEFEVLVDAGSTATVADLTATWDNAEVDVHLFAGDHGSSRLYQPIEYGPEYLATVVEGCTVIPITLMVPGLGNSIVARDVTVQLTAASAQPNGPHC